MIFINLQVTSTLHPRGRGGGGSLAYIGNTGMCRADDPSLHYVDSDSWRPTFVIRGNSKPNNYFKAIFTVTRF